MQDNRWTNRTYCDEVLGVVGSNGGAVRRDGDNGGSDGDGVANGVDADRGALTRAPRRRTSLRSGTLTEWAPKPTQPDLLSTRCLTATRQMEAVATGVDGSNDVTITHVINPFPTSDVHFHWTLPAIVAAHRRAQDAGLRVEVLAITFEDEVLEGRWPDFVTVREITEQSCIRTPPKAVLLDLCFYRGRGGGDDDWSSVGGGGDSGGGDVLDLGGGDGGGCSCGDRSASCRSSR
jgi:hypothetical protein